MITVFISVYVVLGGRFALSGEISIGQYLTNLEVYAQMCSCWNSVYAELLTLNAALPAVEQVSRYLNLPIDLNKRRQMGNSAQTINEHEREQAREILRIQREKGEEAALYASDTIPLVLQDIGFEYRSLSYDMTIRGSLEEETVASKKKKQKQNETERKREVDVEAGGDAMHVRSSIDVMEAHINWNMSLAQGSITALIGKHGEGKGTLLKIIGGVLLPTSGSFFVPPQLRTCFVTQHPMFFFASLFDNLSFGLTALQRKMPGKMEYMRSVCRLFDISEPIIAELDNVDTARDWHQTLSMAQLKKIHLARSFVANPEVLVLERPTAGLDGVTLQRLMQLFRLYVDQRGLIDDGSDESDHLKRPRTVIYTTERLEACVVADNVYMVKPNMLRPVEHHKISDIELYQPWHLDDV